MNRFGHRLRLLPLAGKMVSHLFWKNRRDTIFAKTCSASPDSHQARGKMARGKRGLQPIPNVEEKAGPLPLTKPLDSSLLESAGPVPKVGGVEG